MSDEQEDKKPKKKGMGMVTKLLMGLVLLAAGGGGVFGLMAAGIIGGGAQAEPAEPQGPQLVLKGEEDPYALPAGKGEAEIEMVYGEGGSKYRTAYFDFGDDFTSNLKNSEALVQVSLAASTQRDGRVLMWLKEHQTAIRSRMLVELANTGEEEVFTPEGKKKLQQRMTDAINEVLVDREGFGGVDRVYFRTFIVQ
ncbi:flagellar FliL protein [Altererythrobacter atlanticus]|uniref:Flagellar protein FliL n=1 Tax=Croceibacterium atlanticum TaxID=1267766 RepID=A0A0F7KZ98_9SPHN|nr:flagellar basal body-associated FliL family protein [Croceibacterium atlanticum]AKH44160.1 flagellar basal body-associated protein FliL [Croceibacterium atlanticum]MBB5732471.1 flagellar FliL protein [Croceibacterium atlanticum]